MAKRLSTREQVKLAEAHLARAKDNEDEEEQVLWAFYALENAVTAAASHCRIEYTNAHWSKQAAAKRLSKDHGLPNVASLIGDLNDARKSTAYGDVDDPGLDSADVLAQVEEYIKEVKKLLK